MQCSTKWEAKVKWLAHKCKYSTKLETGSSFSDPFFFTSFLLEAIRRHPIGELKFRVVLCIMKDFLFVLFTLLVPWPLLLGGCDHGFNAKSEVTQIHHSLTIDKSSNILTWFAFLRVLYFFSLPSLYHTTSWDPQLNNTIFIHIPSKEKNPKPELLKVFCSPLNFWLARVFLGFGFFFFWHY